MKKLIKALKICSLAHGFEGVVSEEDAQFYILACNVPTAFDIQSIVAGFTGSKEAVEADFTHGGLRSF